MSTEDVAAITMPKWGMTMEDGELMEWSVAVGDVVTVGQEVATVETDKITGVVESPVAGMISRIVAQPGDTLPVGSLLAVVSVNPVDESAIEGFVRSFTVDG